MNLVHVVPVKNTNIATAVVPDINWK